MHDIAPSTSLIAVQAARRRSNVVPTTYTIEEAVLAVQCVTAYVSAAISSNVLVA